VGTIRVYINDELWKELSVFPSENIDKSDFSDTIKDVFHIWMKIFAFEK
jgi:hypothetical protein